MKTYKMRLYYVAYNFGVEVDCIDGPFMSYVDASDARIEIMDGCDDDEKLIIVFETKEVYGV